MPKDSIDEAVHLMDKDEIADFEDDLENFKVKFVYKKKNGMTRTALGTRNQRWITEDIRVLCICFHTTILKEKTPGTSTFQGSIES